MLGVHKLLLLLLLLVLLLLVLLLLVLLLLCRPLEAERLRHCDVLWSIQP
jgi:hypothetical protein